MSPEDIRKKLELAAEHQLLVRLERGDIDPEDFFTGYVSRLGSAFFVLSLVDDNIHINGFACLRYSDVTALAVPAPNEHFIVRALTLRGEYPPMPPPLNLTSPLELVRSACAAMPIVTVFTEEDDPEVCWIGQLRSWSDDLIVLDIVTPDGEWDVDPFQIDLPLITRVDFGGEYENALMLVAGPKSEHRSR